MITPTRMMTMLLTSSDGISDEAVKLVEIALAWAQGREMDVVNMLYPEQTDAWRIMALTDWESAMMYVKDPEVGFDHSWETVKDLLAHNFPDYLPKHATIVGYSNTC